MSENSEFTNRRAPPIIRRVSILLSDPNCADIDINEDFILQKSIPNSYLEEGDRYSNSAKEVLGQGIQFPIFFNVDSSCQLLILQL